MYLGEIVHKGEAFEGEHLAIITDDLWQAVEAKLKANASGTSRRLKSQQPSLFVGLVFDGEGRAMTPSHATKPGKRYRYYVTRPDQLDDGPAWRVSAYDLEQIVCNQLAERLTDQPFIHDLASGAPIDAIHQALANADIAAAALKSGRSINKAQLLSQLIERITLLDDSVEVVIDLAGLAKLLELGEEVAATNAPLTLKLPATKVRRGHQLRLMIPGPQSLNVVAAHRDEKLVALVTEAFAARKLILAHPEQSIAGIATSQSRCRTRLTKLAALACLAPDIVTAIVEGRQPASLTARTLQNIDLPHDWREQRALLGFV